MTSSLIRGRYVICRVVDRGSAHVVEDGAVYQEDGTIVEVGPSAQVAAHRRPDEVLGSREHVVFPGLVNSHHHVGLTPFQLGSPDYPLELWFASRLAARDVDPYLDTLYSAFEMLESGVTTVQHLHGWRVAPASRVTAIAERIIQAYEDVGMRVSYSYATRDQNRLVYEADEAFLRRLPPELAAELAAWFHGQTIPLEDHLRLFVELWEHYGRNTRERVRVQLAPANLHWCSDPALRALRDHAERYRVGLHMHLVETAYQKAYALRRMGTTAVRHLADLGLLGPALTLGHGVWLTGEDIDLVARSGTMVCHNASSNLRLRSGIAPLNQLTARGVRVALGLDEAGVNDDRDMLQEMRLVLRLHRVPGMADVVPTPAQVLQMATEHGAATTGFADRIGVLEPGRAADLVVMSWPHLAHPYLEPATPVVDALVYRGRATGVETVIVGGQVVLRDGRVTRVDKTAALEALAAALGTPRRPEEEPRRRLAREIFPHVRRFYEGWLDGVIQYAPLMADREERELDGSITEYDEVDVAGDRVERLLTELFTQHWALLTVGPLIQGAVFEVRFTAAPAVTMLDGYLTVDVGSWHFHLCVNDHRDTTPALAAVRRVARAAFFRTRGGGHAPMSWGLRLWNGRGEQMVTVLFPSAYYGDRLEPLPQPDWSRIALWEGFRERYACEIHAGQGRPA